MKGLPSPPKPESKSKFAQYEAALKITKTEIYNSLWIIDYYILKSSNNAQDFNFLMNEVPIEELHLFIIKGFLEN